jgi:hypothetical protein
MYVFIGSLAHGKRHPAGSGNSANSGCRPDRSMLPEKAGLKHAEEIPFRFLAP